MNVVVLQVNETVGAGRVGNRNPLEKIQPPVISFARVNLAPANDHTLGDPKAVFTSTTFDRTPYQVVTDPEALTAGRAADQNHRFG